MGSLRAGTCILGLLLLAGVASAEQTGEIRGTIVDSGGTALGDVRITASGPSLQGTRSVLSDSAGGFRLLLLPVGTYSLTFSRPGFEDFVLSDVEVRLAFTATFDVTLELSGQVEEIVVTAKNPLIDRTRADNSYRFDGDELALLPLQSRNMAEVVGLTPGVTGIRARTGGTGGSPESGWPSFRGEGAEGNNWIIDGVSAKGANFNELAIGLNHDAWDEVQIVSDGFAPELGQALGGVISVVSKSGGNELHGEVGTRVRDRHLRAKRDEQLSVATSPETSLQQYFGNLGGPILKDKLWFFVSDNVRSTMDDTEANTIGWLEIPAGYLRTNANSLFGKLSATPWEGHSFFVSGTHEQNFGQTGGIGLPETYNRFTKAKSSYRLDYSGILPHKARLMVAWGQYRNEIGNEPLDGDLGPPQYTWNDIGQSTNNLGRSLKATQRRSDLTMDVRWDLGSGGLGEHDLGAGFFYYRNSSEWIQSYSGQDFDPWPGNGFDNGSRITWSAPGVPMSMMESGPAESNNASSGGGLYLKDTWVFGRSSLMLGLRAETQTVRNDLGKEVWHWGLGDFLSPRVSYALDLTGDGKNVVKLGYGKFVTPQTVFALSLFNELQAWVFRIHRWVGGMDPTDAELRSPDNWRFMFEQSSEASAMEVDPDLKPNQSHKYLVELDRQLGTRWVVKARGVHSSAKNLTDTVAFYDPTSASTTKTRQVYANLSLKRRSYWALETEVSGRIGERWTLRASYTWSAAKGTFPGQFESFNWDTEWGGGLEYTDFGTHPLIPESEPDKTAIDEMLGGMGGVGTGDEGWYGYLPYSVDHNVKLLATWKAPHGLNVSAIGEYISGYHWEKKGLFPLLAVYATFPEGRGVRTTPGHFYLDLGLDKELRLREGVTLALGLNVANLFNSQKPVSFIKADTDLFGEVWARQDPRWVQLKAGLRF